MIKAKKIKLLSKHQVCFMHEKIIEETGGSPGLRDEKLLDSALNAPFQTFGGSDVYPSIEEKAAHLCFGLVNNHSFVDGNKRIGAHCLLVFLGLNEIELSYDQTELSTIIWDLAKGSISLKDLLNWILDHET